MSLDHGIESMPSTSLDASPGTCSRCGFRAEPEAEACPRCGTTISLVGANQRITNFCRSCQPGGLIKGM